MRAHSAPLKQISSRIAEAHGAAPFKRVFWHGAGAMAWDAPEIPAADQQALSL